MSFESFEPQALTINALHAELQQILMYNPTNLPHIDQALRFNLQIIQSPVNANLKNLYIELAKIDHILRSDQKAKAADILVSAIVEFSIAKGTGGASLDELQTAYSYLLAAHAKVRNIFDFNYHIDKTSGQNVLKAQDLQLRGQRIPNDSSKKEEKHDSDSDNDQGANPNDAIHVELQGILKLKKRDNKKSIFKNLQAAKDYQWFDEDNADQRILGPVNTIIAEANKAPSQRDINLVGRTLKTAFEAYHSNPFDEGLRALEAALIVARHIDSKITIRKDTITEGEYVVKTSADVDSYQPPSYINTDPQIPLLGSGEKSKGTKFKNPLPASVQKWIGENKKKSIALGALCVIVIGGGVGAAIYFATRKSTHFDLSQRTDVTSQYGRTFILIDDGQGGLVPVDSVSFDTNVPINASLPEGMTMTSVKISKNNIRYTFTSSPAVELVNGTNSFVEFEDMPGTFNEIPLNPVNIQATLGNGTVITIPHQTLTPPTVNSKIEGSDTRDSVTADDPKLNTMAQSLVSKFNLRSMIIDLPTLLPRSTWINEEARVWSKIQTDKEQIGKAMGLQMEGDCSTNPNSIEWSAFMADATKRQTAATNIANWFKAYNGILFDSVTIKTLGCNLVSSNVADFMTKLKAQVSADVYYTLPLGATGPDSLTDADIQTLNTAGVKFILDTTTAGTLNTAATRLITLGVPSQNINVNIAAGTNPVQVEAYASVIKSSNLGKANVDGLVSNPNAYNSTVATLNTALTQTNNFGKRDFSVPQITASENTSSGYGYVAAALGVFALGVAVVKNLVSSESKEEVKTDKTFTA